MDERDLAELVRGADRLTVIGGGTRGPFDAGLTVAGGVTLYEPAAMTLVARAARRRGAAWR